ncbi:hypothetical protein JCM10213_004998 [Rhodosporidiobolus nylandii]
MVSTLLRTALRTARAAPAPLRASPTPVRFLATSSISHSSNGGFSRPSPPPLPPQQQREFEELLRRQNAPASAPAEDGRVELGQPEMEELGQHPDYRARPKAEFEGDRNPLTGETGGPKREPLVHGDWAYGGKVTDF